MSYSFAYVNGGWGLTGHGQIQRATSVVDKVRRVLRPLWGAVWSAPDRGNAPTPKGLVDSLGVMIADRVFFLLEPLLRRGEISNLTVDVAETSDAKRRRVQITFLDENKKPHSLSEFVRVL